VIAGVVSYMLLCWGAGVVFAGLVSLISSPYSSESCQNGRYRPKHVFPLPINTII